MASARSALGHRTADAPWLSLLAAIGGAWSLIVLAEATGMAPALHHHALIENGPPLPVAIAMFGVAWLVMVVAMMVPASLGTMRDIVDAGIVDGRPWRVVGTFLLGYLAIWSGFGLAAFSGDIGVHRIVDATPWLGARPWLIEAGVLALAGAFQFLPVTRRGIAAARRGGGGPMILSGGETAVRLGVGHGIACLGATWALMLVMFAEGADSLGWMVALTGLMAWQATSRDPDRARSVTGVVLLLAALSVLAGAGPGA